MAEASPNIASRRTRPSDILVYRSLANVAKEPPPMRRHDLTSSIPPLTPAARVAGLIDGFWTTQVLCAAVALRLPDLLASGPRTPDVLARASEAHAPSVARLLRALVTLGICRAAANGAYELTDTGQLLRADILGSARGRTLFNGGMLWRQFGDLTNVVKFGRTTTAMVSGREGFDRLADDPVTLAAFQQAMAESSIRAAEDATKVYDFSRFKTVLDVGGGYGGVLSVLLRTNPKMEGAVFDLAYLAKDAESYLSKAGVATRARFIGGDFFKAVPAGYDCYHLKFIIHDWDDEHALAILKSCCAVSTKDTKLILLEQVVPDVLEDKPEHRAVIRGRSHHDDDRRQGAHRQRVSRHFARGRFHVDRHQADVI